MLEAVVKHQQRYLPDTHTHTHTQRNHDINTASILGCSLPQAFLWGQRLALCYLTLIASIHSGRAAAVIAAKYAIVCIPSELTAKRGNVPHITG